MLSRHAARELLRHPLRTALAMAGVAVATAMLVDMLALGAGLETSFASLLRGRGYELRVTPRGTLPLDTEATLGGAAALRDSLEAFRSVAGAAPLLAANLLLAADAEDPAPGDAPPEEPPAEAGAAEGEALRVFALGVDPEEQGAFRLVEGRPPLEAGDVVVGSEVAEEARLRPGDAVRLRAPGGLAGDDAGRRYRVTGIGEFLYAAREERPVAMRLEELQWLTDRPDRASFFMVRLAPGADPGETAAALARALPAVEAVSVAEIVRRAEERLAYFRQLAWILGSVSVVVTVLLVGTLVSVSINERYGTFAALRAIGVRRRSILASLAVESLTLCAVAGLAGLLLGGLTGRYLESILAGFPGLPRAVRFFVIRAESLALAYGTLLLTGIVAALVPGWRATGTDIAVTLHAEEP